MNYICLWGILASITGIAIMFSVIKHKKSVICFGITFLNITYKDRRNYPPSFTISYINYLQGYVVGFMSIMYALFRIFE